jgi:hypothetical protein
LFDVILFIYGCWFIIYGLFSLWAGRVHFPDIQKGGMMAMMFIFIPPFKCFCIARGRHPSSSVLYIVSDCLSGFAVLYSL